MKSNNMAKAMVWLNSLNIPSNLDWCIKSHLFSYYPLVELVSTDHIIKLLYFSITSFKNWVKHIITMQATPTVNSKYIFSVCVVLDYKQISHSQPCHKIKTVTTYHQINYLEHYFQLFLNFCHQLCGYRIENSLYLQHMKTLSTTGMSGRHWLPYF